MAKRGTRCFILDNPTKTVNYGMWQVPEALAELIETLLRVGNDPNKPIFEIQETP